jgi:glycosyltransferase involved in cell wall biosynthesis
MMINKLFKIPYVTIAHGIDVWNLKGLKLKGLANSFKILSVSNYTKQRILQQLTNYPEKNIFILPDTFAPERFKPAPKPEYLMKRWNIKNGDRVILTIARLSKSEQYKGYDKVLLALSQLLNPSTSTLTSTSTFPSQLPNFKYIIGGCGDDMPRIKSLIRKLNLEEYVILPGFIPDEELIDYYNLCDVFVMPSKKEGFGIVFLEALACGKPVICGNKDGSVDAVLGGEVGTLVDPDNIDKIASAIINVLKGDADKRLLNEKYLRKRVIEAYGFDKFKERVRLLMEKGQENEL